MRDIEQNAPVTRNTRVTNGKRTRERIFVVGGAIIAVIMFLSVFSTLSASGQTEAKMVRRIWPATTAERRVRDEAIASRDAVFAKVQLDLQKQAETAWYAAVAKNEADRKAAEQAARAKSQSVRSSVRRSNGCDGLEGCRTCVTNAESATAGLYNAYNPSGAAGRYQVMPNTWGGFGGYASAKDAPAEVQDAWFNQAYSRFHGSSEWSQLYTDGC